MNKKITNCINKFQDNIISLHISDRYQRGLTVRVELKLTKRDYKSFKQLSEFITMLFYLSDHISAYKMN